MYMHALSLVSVPLAGVKKKNRERERLCGLLTYELPILLYIFFGSVHIIIC